MIATNTLRKAMHDIANKKGPFTLFGLFKRPDAFGKWDLVVSAPWLDKSQLKATRELVALLTDSVGAQALQHLARIQPLDTDSPELKAVLEGFGVDNGDVRIKHTNLFGLDIEDAIILRAKAAGKKPRKPVLETAAR